MAFWRRIRPETLYHQASRLSLLHPGTPAASRDDGKWRFGSGETYLGLGGQVRSFAARVQAKAKASADASAEPRLNEAITAPFVRLVTGDGHGVVSRLQALNHARELNLDLVEVQKTADPPVCKIMDFHKEKYKQETKEKERVKSKSALTLRSGENKEIRFKAKTELKDLKMKAETITRLMERGYRVKCTAMPTGNGEEDLGALLSRLLALIEDVSVVQSGPHVDSSKAYVIVRHVRFVTKKAGKKASKVLEAVASGVPSSAPTTPADCRSTRTDETSLQDEDEWEPIDDSSSTDSEDNHPEAKSHPLYSAPLASFKSGPTRVNEYDFKANDTRFADTKLRSPVSNGPYFNPRSATSRPDVGLENPRVDLGKEDMSRKATAGPVSSPQGPSVVEHNRYSRPSDSRGRFNQPRSPHRSTGPADIGFNQQRQQLPQNEGEERGWLNPRQRQIHPNSPKPPSPSPHFGLFSSKPDASGDGRRSTPNNPGDQKSLGDPRSKPAPNYGTFTADKSRSPNSSRPGYGIFSATNPTASGDQRNLKDDPMANSSNPSSPTPRYGIFSSSHSATSGEQKNEG